MKDKETRKDGCCCGKHEKEHKCACEHDESRTCGEDCVCESECGCNDGCTCGEDCACHEGERCSEGCTCEQGDKSGEYLELARRIQAEFENFRRRTDSELKRAREEGEISVIEAFLPSLDTFKVAKKSISDEKVLSGVEMIENSILGALKSLGVERIEAIGSAYDPHLHNAIAVMRDEGKENDIVLDEYQAGYKYKEKVIRYSKVIVNKKED